MHDAARFSSSSVPLDQTRREFVAASCGLLALYALAESGTPSASLRPVSPEAAVLSLSDLVVPAGVAYTEWSIDVEDAALVGHLTERLPWFRPTDGAASGFVASDETRVPLYVESGAVALDEIGSRRALLGAVDEWFRRSHPGVEISVGESEGGVQWTATDTGWVDTLWVTTSGGLVAFVGVCGRSGAEVEPSESGTRYEQSVVRAIRS